MDRFINIINNENPVSDFIPFAYHVDKHTVACKNKMLMQVIRVQGFYSDTLDPLLVDQRKRELDTLLCEIADADIAIYQHTVRTQDKILLSNPYTGFAKDLHEQWSELIRSKGLYRSDVYITVVRKAPVKLKASKLLFGLFSKNDTELRKQLREEQLAHLNEVVQQLLSGLTAYQCQLLTTHDFDSHKESELVNFFSHLVNGCEKRLVLPQSDLAKYIGDTRLFFGLDSLAIRDLTNDRLAAVLSIDEYCSTTYAGATNRLNSLAFEFIVTQSFSFLDRKRAQDNLSLHFDQMESAGDSSVSQTNELLAAIDGVQSGDIQMGKHHLSITVFAHDEIELRNNITLVKEVLSKDLKLKLVRESIGLKAAYFAQLPGNQHLICRAEEISTRNFCGFSSLHLPPKGQLHNNHWGEALTCFYTEDNNLYYFNFHVGQLGHTLLIGPSRSGKTVVLGMLLTLLQKYGCRRIVFDKDRSNELAIKANKGDYERLQVGKATGFNPLQLEDTKENRLFLFEWFCVLLTASDSNPLNERDQETVRTIIQHVFDKIPLAKRRLQIVASFLTAKESHLARKLKPFYGAGDYAYLFDNPIDELDLDRGLFGIDCGAVLNDDAIRPIVFRYLMHRFIQLLDGKPTVLAIDEAWKYFKDGYFSDQLDNFMRTAAKKNALVILATTDIDDAKHSNIQSTLRTQVATNIFFPNYRASIEDYSYFGVTEHEVEIIKGIGQSEHKFLAKTINGDSIILNGNMSGMDDFIRALSTTEKSARELDNKEIEEGRESELCEQE